MRVVLVHPKLVRVERSGVVDQYVTLTPHGWCDDKTGRAVCPVTKAAIAGAVRP